MQNAWTDKSKYFSLLVLAALFLVSSEAIAIDVGVQAPAFKANTFEDTPVSLETFKGKVVYLDFWASWCPPCRKTLPWMEQMHRKYGPNGLVVVAINLDTNKAAAKKLLDAVSAHFLVVADPDGKIATEYSPPAMPSSYMIDRTGVVHSIFKGFSGNDDEIIEGKIKEMLSINN